MRDFIPMAVVLAVVAVADQVTKALVLARITPGERIGVIPGLFDLTLAFNPGAAFGVFADIPDETLRLLLLGVSSCIALGVVMYFLFSDYRQDGVARLALALILGGALGNIIDRVRLGVVVDFLDFYLGQYHWPAFNVADSAICVGVAILLFRKPKREGDAAMASEGRKEPSGSSA